MLKRILFLFCIITLLSSQAFGLDFFEKSDCDDSKFIAKSVVHNVQTGESSAETFAIKADGHDCVADTGGNRVAPACERYMKVGSMTANLEKTRLDGQFTLIKALDQQELRLLSADYQALKKQLIAQIQDIDDRQQVLYRHIRSSQIG